VIFNSAQVAPKTSRSSQGVGVLTLKPKYQLEDAKFLADTPIKNVTRYRVRTIPAAGARLQEEDRGEEQMNLLDN
jgi:DNA gyrase subunit A